MSRMTSSLKANIMQTFSFDIETRPLSKGAVEKWMPEFEAPANYKDEAKIEAYIQKKRESWMDGAALSPLTSEVCVIGYYDGMTFSYDHADDAGEGTLLAGFWERIPRLALTSGPRVIGHNIKGFDLPYLVQRSWMHGMSVPPAAYTYGRYGFRWSESFVDTAELWRLGGMLHGGLSPADFNTIAKAMGGEPKPFEAKQWWKMWNEDKKAALDYLRIDVISPFRWVDAWGVRESHMEQDR